MIFLITIVRYAVEVLSIVVIIDVVLSYFMSPYQPIRQTLDSIVNPLLNPIRRVLPSVGGLDFSPIILLVIIQVLGGLLINLLISIA